MRKKLGVNYARMLLTALNKFQSKTPTIKRQQLYLHLRSISQTIQVKRKRYAEHCYKRKDIEIYMFRIMTRNS